MAFTYPNAMKLALRGDTDDGVAAAATVRTRLGSGWRARIYAVTGDTQVATGTAAGSLGGTGADVTGSVSVTASAAIDPASAGYYARIEKADGSDWIRGTVGLPGSGADCILSRALANAETANVSVNWTLPLDIDPSALHVVAINAGGVVHTDASGRVFLADTHASGGAVGVTTEPIAGTTEDVLYQSERWGSYSYVIPVTSGTYQVTLHLCELFGEITAAGQRVFDVKLQPGTGQEVLIEDIDIFAAAGFLAAYDLTREVVVTGSTLTIQTLAVTQNPKINAISITSTTGGAYVPPTTGGGGTEGRGNLVWIKRFKQDNHDARLGLMSPSLFDWALRGRPYDQDTILWNRDNARIVPWHTIFAAGDKLWPQTVGVEVGLSQLWGYRISTSLYQLLYSWPSHTYFAHNRDNYGAEVEPRVAENFGTAPYPSADTERSTNAGTRVVKRMNNASFPVAGTHIHGYYEGANGTDHRSGSPVAAEAGRPRLDRTLYDLVMFEVQMRAVGYPSADNLAPITNPAGHDETSIVALVAADSYTNDGDFEATYRGDLGIARAAYVTNSWQSFYWYTCLPTTLDTKTPPWV